MGTFEKRRTNRRDPRGKALPDETVEQYSARVDAHAAFHAERVDKEAREMEERRVRYEAAKKKQAAAEKRRRDAAEAHARKEEKGRPTS